MTTHHTLSADGVRLGYGDRTVVPGLDLEVPTGEITVIVGANACGKSTLLRSMARLLKPQAGAILLDGEQIHRLRTKDVARVLGSSPSRRWHQKASR